MNMKKISHKMKLQKWTQVVEECRNSGKTNEKWCTENDINIKTCYYCQRNVLNAVCNDLAIANNNVEKSPVFIDDILPGIRSSEVA